MIWRIVMINNVNSVSNSTMNMQSSLNYANNQLIETPKEDLLTPEQKNTVDNYLYEANAEETATTQAKQSAIWEQAVYQSYVQSQKEVVEAYVVSATGDSSYNSENDNNKSLTETYESLRKFQEIKELQQPNVPNIPELPEDDISIQPLEANGNVNAQINAYETTQSQAVSSLIHLSA